MEGKKGWKKKVGGKEANLADHETRQQRHKHPNGKPPHKKSLGDGGSGRTPHRGRGGVHLDQKGGDSGGLVGKLTQRGQTNGGKKKRSHPLGGERYEEKQRGG